LKCEEFNVAGKLIATATDIDHIAIFGENANVPALKGWRREIFGNDALKLKDGELYLTVKSNKLIVIAKDSLTA
jgi:ribonuclease D